MLLSSDIQAYNHLKDTLEPAVFAKLETYVALLQEASSCMNLIAPSTLSFVWLRHVLDSYQIQSLISPGSTVLDVGSGAGFPGLVLSLVRPDLSLTLLDSCQKKINFLQNVSRETSVSPITCWQRAVTHGLQYNVVVARAVSPLKNLIPLTKKNVKRNGCAIFLKGRRYQEELLNAKKIFSFSYDVHSSITSAEGKVIVVKY